MELIDRQAATTIPVMPKENRNYQTNNLDDAYEHGWTDLQECIENLPQVQPNHNAEPGKMVADTISRQAAMEKLMAQNIIMDGSEYHNGFNAGVNRAQELIRNLRPVQTELYKDDVSRQAVKHLDLFTKAYCRDESVTNGLVFRCKQCDFEMPDGKCLVKTMARKLCPNYKNFGCMGDL